MDDLKVEYGPDFTYLQGFMVSKNVLCAGLMNENTMYEGPKLTQKEVLNPTVKKFMTYDKRSSLYKRKSTYYIYHQLLIEPFFAAFNSTYGSQIPCDSSLK